MDYTEKLNTVKILLSDGGEVPSDDKLMTYLQLAANEIIAWKYHLLHEIPSGATVPVFDEGALVYGVVAGYTHAGAEGQKGHSENGVSRTFIYSDMLDYIRDHVIPYARVV